MYAMILDKNLNFAWQEVPDPVRKSDEVLIKVHAAAVNRADLMQKEGRYASPEGWPQWCGLEASGEVVAAPANSSFRAGDHVCALLGGGGYSELVTVPEGMVVSIPEGLTMVEAASLPEAWCTVYLNIQVEAGGMKAGDVLYVQAGASGVGLAAIQYAKHLGAEVITTVGSEAKVEFLRKLGADHVLNYKTDDILEVLKKYPPTVALDCVGGKQMGQGLQQMAFGGRWIMIASMGGGETLIDLETVWRKRLRLIGSTLRSRSTEEKSAIMKALKEDLWPLFTSGKMITNIHGVFPIQEADEAHDVLRRSENIGKVVLTFS